jgi:hypothetical protein
MSSSSIFGMSSFAATLNDQIFIILNHSIRAFYELTLWNISIDLFTSIFWEHFSLIETECAGNIFNIFYLEGSFNSNQLAISIESEINSKWQEFSININC